MQILFTFQHSLERFHFLLVEYFRAISRPLPQHRLVRPSEFPLLQLRIFVAFREKNSTAVHLHRVHLQALVARGTAVENLLAREVVAEVLIALHLVADARGERAVFGLVEAENCALELEVAEVPEGEELRLLGVLEVGGALIEAEVDRFFLA